MTKILEKKQRTLEYFTQKLLSSKAGKNVARIILFGSLAKGEADESSDIDLMIFAREPKKVEDVASDLSYEILLKKGEPVEPHVYPDSDYKTPKTYFVKLAVETGQLIYPVR